MKHERLHKHTQLSSNRVDNAEQVKSEVAIPAVGDRAYQKYKRRLKETQKRREKQQAKRLKRDQSTATYTSRGTSSEGEEEDDRAHRSNDLYSSPIVERPPPINIDETEDYSAIYSGDRVLGKCHNKWYIYIHIYVYLHVLNVCINEKYVIQVVRCTSY